ncbi:MAG: sulfatase-like hydrolase/transferase, partial [Parasporobacterium sp.]|nr:sulfatase-like hydrolase/transferase [Parasporobacterium sp.]
MNDFRKWFSYKWKKWRSDAPSIRKMDRARAKKETRRRYIKHLILFPVVLIYLELMLKLLTGTGMFTHFIFPVLFGISAGLFFSIITSFLKAKTNRVLRIILLILMGVFYGLEFFMKQVFGVYMPLITIINGTGGIANDFLGYAIGVILKGIPVIILVLLPAAWYILFGRRVVPSLRLKPKKMLLPAIICVVLFFVTLIFASTGKPGLIYTSRYSYDSATEYFGLQTGLRLDIKYSIFGNKAAKTLIIEEQESTEEAETNPAESENNTPVVTGDNVMNLPLDELNASTGDSEVREMNAYVASLKPSNKNAYTGLFKGKNLIIICAESLTDVIVTPELTPTLYRLMHNGIYLSDYYQPTWGGSTVTGEFSTLTGLVPMRLEDEMSFTVGENMYFTMGNQLQRLGYFSEAYHTGSYDYYDRQSTHQNLGYDNYYGNGNGLEVLTNSDWAGDVAAMDAIVDRIASKQPFSIYYMTISGHFPYSSDSATTEKHYDEVQAAFPDRYGDAFNYICSELELEEALTVLVEKLEAA